MLGSHPSKVAYVMAMHSGLHSVLLGFCGAANNLGKGYLWWTLMQPGQ
jgi:hypothetical protein